MPIAWKVSRHWLDEEGPADTGRNNRGARLRLFGVILSAVLIGVLLAACAAPRQEGGPVALPPAPPPGEPVALAGLEAPALRLAFGEPAFVRKDGEVEMWRYDNAVCRAFFFLYPAGNALIVRHVETVPRGQDMAADAGCLALLRVHAPVS